MAILSKSMGTLEANQINDFVTQILEDAVANKQISAASLYVARGERVDTHAFGLAKNSEAMFLLGSISKPIAVAGLMTLYDLGEFQLDDPVKKFLPTFLGQGREEVTIKHLLTHTSGLPDQLAQNDTLRRSHATLEEFVAHALATPLQFRAGTQYQYSSMGILLASAIAERILSLSFPEFIQTHVFDRLRMQHAAQGLGRFSLKDMMPVQTEFGAKESGGGDPSAQNWDWNSSYWRSLGAPWGGTHASASNIGVFLAEFLFAKGALVQPKTARLMTTNQNAPGLPPRGLGFNVGIGSGSQGCSDRTFGHTGSTGTLAWADPAKELICVVLTSLPGAAVTPHPRELVGARVASSA